MSSVASITNYFFPTLGGEGVALDMETLSADYRTRTGDLSCMSADTVTKVVADYLSSVGAAWGAGGWMEWRPERFRGNYMEADSRYLHLGIDYAAPVGTPVILPVNAELLHSDIDTSQDIGWGGRLFIRPMRSKTVFLLCHLDPERLWEKPRYTKGEPIGFLGQSTVNGGVDPHLHLQAMSLETFLHHRLCNFSDLDGYATADRRDEVARLYPHPHEAFAAIAK